MILNDFVSIFEQFLVRRTIPQKQEKNETNRLRHQ
jgi:hypothetical protein